MSTYGASGLMGQWLESNGEFGAVPAGPVFRAETSYGGDGSAVFGALNSLSLQDELAYGAVPGGPVFDAETSYGAVPGGPVFDAETSYGAVPGGPVFDAETSYGDGGEAVFGALNSLSLQDELAYAGEDFGALDSMSLEDELAYGAEPAGNVYESEMAYGGEDELFGAFEKATAKGRIAKLYRISARIQYLVDMGKVDVAREKAKKLLSIWAKLSAMPDAQPLISAALQDEMARLSAFASGQTNNPHDAVSAYAPGVAVDPTMTGGSGGASLFSTNLDALYSDPVPSSSGGGYLAASSSYVPVIAPPVVAPVPVYPRPLYARPPRRPLLPAVRQPMIRRGQYRGLEEEDFGAASASNVHTYRIRRGPGAGTTLTSSLDKASFGRCRRLAGRLRTKDVKYVGNGKFQAKGGHSFEVKDASFLAECSRVSKIVDKGQSFGMYGSEE